MTFRVGGAQSVPEHSAGRLFALVILAVVAICAAFLWSRPWLARLGGASHEPPPGGGIVASDDVDSLVSARAADVENELRARMERDLDAMRQKVEAAKRAATARERREAQELLATGAEVPPRDRQAAVPSAATPSVATPPPRRPSPSPTRRAVPRRPARRRSSDPPSPSVRPARPPSRAAPRSAFRALPRVGSRLSRESSPPRRLNSPSARFPSAAADDSRAERLVPVRVWIDEHGRVTNAALRRPTNSSFEEPALRTALTTRFVPATANGTPVTSTVTLLVHFRR